MIYSNFVKLCASIGKSPSAVAQELGINKSTVSNWKHRKNGPSDVTIEKICKYFNVPVSALTGEEQKEKSPVGITDEADEDLVEIAKLLKQLSPEALKRELAYLRSLSNDSNN